MPATQSLRSLVHPAAAMLTGLVWIVAFPSIGWAQTPRPAPKTFAQQLVDATHAAHPEADEIGISATTSSGCKGIASTDKSDIGEKCEADDIKPMRTGKPFVEKEKDGYDVSLPLHDSDGKVIGVVGVGFKLVSGQTEASVTAQARKIAAEMEAKIPSKAKLFARAQ